MTVSGRLRPIFFRYQHHQPMADRSIRPVMLDHDGWWCAAVDLVMVSASRRASFEFFSPATAHPAPGSWVERKRAGQFPAALSMPWAGFPEIRSHAARFPDGESSWRPVPVPARAANGTALSPATRLSAAGCQRHVVDQRMPRNGVTICWRQGQPAPYAQGVVGKPSNGLPSSSHGALVGRTTP